MAANNFRTIKIESLIDGCGRHGLVDGMNLRLFGRLVVIENFQAEIEGLQKDKRLLIDTRLIQPLYVLPGSLVQVTGELVLPSAKSTLLLIRAVTIRSVDGLDLTAMYKALDLQSEYLASHRGIVNIDSSSNK